MSAGVRFVVVSTTVGLTLGLYGPVIQTYAAELVRKSTSFMDEIDVLRSVQARLPGLQARYLDDELLRRMTRCSRGRLCPQWR